MGWLLSTNKNTYVFIGDINFNEDGTINEGGNSTVIPKSNILKLKEINYDEMNEAHFELHSANKANHEQKI